MTINGYTYRNTVAVMGGEYMVGVANEHRKPAKVENGGTVDVTLELDTEKREVTVPPELAAALAKDKAAKAAWDKLSYSHQRQHAEPIAAAKAEDTKAQARREDDRDAESRRSPSEGTDYACRGQHRPKRVHQHLRPRLALIDGVEPVEEGAVLAQDHLRALAVRPELDGRDRNREARAVHRHLVGVDDAVVGHDVVVAHLEGERWSSRPSRRSRTRGRLP